MTTARILKDGEIDTLDLFATGYTLIKASSLKPGHVLMDAELEVPGAVIDHRIAAPRGSGAVAFLVADLDRGGWTQIQIHANAQVKVLAR